MRPIKFRAWADGKIYKDVGVVGNIVVLEYNSSEEWDDVDLEPTYYGVRDDSIQLMQYTGLKDKNGTEIYEGDILKRVVTVVVYGSGFPAKDVVEYLDVDYKDEYAGFFIGETPLNYFVGAKYDYATKCRCTDVEVIGNIYEDKHLLEVQT